MVRFIEDNWLRGERLGGGSFDARAGSITAMFNFDQFGFGNQPGFGNTNYALFLDPTAGTVVSPAPPNFH